MIEEVSVKLQALYKEALAAPLSVIQVFNEQFGESLVDSTPPTFDNFMVLLSAKRLHEFIQSYRGANEYGSYHINREDYIAKYDEPFQEAVTDAGIIDYLSPQLKKLTHHLFGFTTDDGRGYFAIVVRFPNVTVTNENDRSINITELYTRVFVTEEGKMYDSLQMMRSEYDELQWISHYSHSHIPSISHDDIRFRSACLGSGPIKNTRDSLRRACDLNLWGLFVYELSKYVTVESLDGVPYIRLESVGGGSVINKPQRIPIVPFLPQVPSYSTARISDFVKHFLATNDIQMSYTEGGWTLAEDFNDFWIRVTDSFGEWHLSNLRDRTTNISFLRLLSYGLLGRYVISNGKICTPQDGAASTDFSNYEGQVLFHFKGEDVRLHITHNNKEISFVYLIDRDICYYIITKAKEIISADYDRHNSNNSSTSEEADSAGSRTLYL